MHLDLCIQFIKCNWLGTTYRSNCGWISEIIKTFHCATTETIKSLFWLRLDFPSCSEMVKKNYAIWSFHEYLSRENIKWQYNLSGISLRGDQYERIIGIPKQSIWKSVRKSLLSFNETKKIMIPGFYAKGTRIWAENAILTEDDLVNIDGKVIKKKQIFIISYKKAVWKGDPKNTLQALRETHDMRRKSTLYRNIKLGDAVLIKTIRIAEGGIWEFWPNSSRNEVWTDNLAMKWT